MQTLTPASFFTACYCFTWGGDKAESQEHVPPIVQNIHGVSYAAKLERLHCFLLTKDQCPGQVNTDSMPRREPRHQQNTITAMSFPQDSAHKVPTKAMSQMNRKEEDLKFKACVYILNYNNPQRGKHVTAFRQRPLLSGAETANTRYFYAEFTNIS